MLKPIWDALYEDAKRNKEEMDQLKKRLADCTKELEELRNTVSILERYNVELHMENNILKTYADKEHMPEIPTIPSIIPTNVSFDDEAYAAEASAPPTNHVKHVEIKNVVEMPTTEPIPETPVQSEEPTKTVKMIGTKTKQEYQREYQRNYRKKQKNITMNL